MHRLIAGALLIACAACGAEAADVARAADNVIHGADDRRDVYQVEDERLRELATRSVVALMKEDRLQVADSGEVTFIGPTLGEQHQLCEGERFADDPTAADCSGTLIADDLVLTAGHCVRGDNPCSELRFVFGYYKTSETELAAVTSDDVFGCSEVVARFDGLTTVGDLDHAIVRLDRVATPRFVSVPVGSAELAGDGALTVVSYGAGVPAKIDSGARVTDARADQRDYFALDSDTFVHSSGAGVFDRTGQTLLGIIVRGQTDFVSTEEGCNVTNLCPGGGCEGEFESASYAHNAIEHACSEQPTLSICAAGD